MGKLILLLPLLLIGCANQAELTQLSNSSTALAALQLQAVQAHKETLIVDCKDGCGKARISYTDPRDIPRVTGSKVTGTNDVIIGVAPAVTRGVGYVAGAVSAIRIADDIFKNSGNGERTENHTTNINNGDNNTNNQTLTASQSEANDNQDNDYTTSQDNSISNTDVSNDKSVTDRNDTVNNDNSQQNQTATPTVVNPVVIQ